MTEFRTNFREPKLREIHKKITDTQARNIQLQAIIMKQNKEREEIWSVRDLRVTKSLAENIKQNALNYIEKHAEVGIRDFMVTNDQSDDYLIEKLPDSEVPVLSKITSEMLREDNSDISYEDLARSSYLKGFAITFLSPLIIFNKVTRNTLFKPKKYLYIIPSQTGEFTGSRSKICFPSQQVLMLFYTRIHFSFSIEIILSGCSDTKMPLTILLPMPSKVWAEL